MSEEDFLKELKLIKPCPKGIEVPVPTLEEVGLETTGKFQLSWFINTLNIEGVSTRDVYNNDSMMREYLQTRFYNVLSDDKNTLKDNLCIAIQVFQNEYSKEVRYFTSIDELVRCLCSKAIYSTCDIFIKGLISRENKGISDEEIVHRTDIVFDFDDKDRKDGTKWVAKDIDELFKQLKIKYTMIVNSGNGLHVYVTLKGVNKDNLYKVSEVNKVMARIVGSDTAVTGLSHLIRVVGTFNNKENRKPKLVKIVKNSAKSKEDGVIDYKSNMVYGYNIEALYKNFVEEGNTEYITKTERIKKLGSEKSDSDIPKGISKCEHIWMTNGVLDGERNETIGKLYSLLLFRGLNKDEIMEQILKFNSVCVPPKDETKVISQVERLWRRSEKGSEKGLKVSGTGVGCDKCTDTTCCYRRANAQMTYEPLKLNELDIYDEDNLVILNRTTQVSYCRKGLKKSMDAKEFFVLTMIAYWKSLSYGKLVEELSYEGKCKYADRTLKNILKSLIEKGHISEKDGVYTEKRKVTDNAENMGVYSAILKNCVQNIVTEEETQFYCYIKSKYIEQYREGLASKKFLYINVGEVAKELGKTDRMINKYLEALTYKAVISKCEKKRREKVGVYYQYRLHF